MSTPVIRVAEHGGVMAVCRTTVSETQVMLCDRAWAYARLLAKGTPGSASSASGASCAIAMHPNDVSDARVLSAAWSCARHLGCSYDGALDEALRMMRITSMQMR
jgi:hypothetical protein